MGERGEEMQKRTRGGQESNPDRCDQDCPLMVCALPDELPSACASSHCYSKHWFQ